MIINGSPMLYYKKAMLQTSHPVLDLPITAMPIGCHATHDSCLGLSSRVLEIQQATGPSLSFLAITASP